MKGSQRQQAWIGKHISRSSASKRLELAQDALAVGRMQPGRVFALTAFVQGAVTGMWLFQILTTCLKMLFFAHGVGLQQAWLHAFLILDTHGLLILALIASWLPVLNAEAKEPKQLSTLGITDLLLSMVYEQVTRSPSSCCLCLFSH